MAELANKATEKPCKMTQDAVMASRCKGKTLRSLRHASASEP